MKNKVAVTLMAALIAANLSACASNTAQQGAASQTEAAQEAENASAEEQKENASAEAQEAEKASAEAQEAEKASAEAQEAEKASAEAQEAEKDAVEAQETEKTAETPAEGTEQSGEPAAEAAVRPVYSTMEYNFMEELGDTMIARGSYAIVKLTEESAAAYPKLNEMIEKENEKIVERFKGGFEEIKEAAKSYCEDNNIDPKDLPETVSDAQITPVRCDNSVVSFYETGYVNRPGTAHGSTGYRTYNFETASGNEIKLTDVFKDVQALRAAVLENLTAVGDGSQVEDENMEEALKSAFDEEYEDLDWVLDQDGVTFIFAPSEIAPYALGTIEAQIAFAAYPDLFTDKYGPAKEGYVKELDPSSAVKVDVDGDGSGEKVLVSGVSESDDNNVDYTGLKVEIGDQSCTAEDYFFSYKPYFVRAENGDSYIYVVTTSDNDYQKLIVFEVKDKAVSVAGTLEGTGNAYSFHETDEKEETGADSYIENMNLIDPSCFALATRMNLMSSYSAYRFYKVGSDGMPEALTDYYMISIGRVLTSRVPLTVEKVDTATGAATGEETELPAGSKCSFWHTNGEDTVDFMLEDGSAVRVKVVSEDGQQKVNGAGLEEAFDGTGFAG